jgi:hypothetical protein
MTTPIAIIQSGWSVRRPAKSTEHSHFVLLVQSSQVLQLVVEEMISILTLISVIQSLSIVLSLMIQK